VSERNSYKYTKINDNMNIVGQTAALDEKSMELFSQLARGLFEKPQKNNFENI